MLVESVPPGEPPTGRNDPENNPLKAAELAAASSNVMFRLAALLEPDVSMRTSPTPFGLTSTTVASEGDGCEKPLIVTRARAAFPTIPEIRLVEGNGVARLRSGMMIAWELLAMAVAVALYPILTKKVTAPAGDPPLERLKITGRLVPHGTDAANLKVNRLVTAAPCWITAK